MNDERTVLSIDFDYFVPEDPSWDFGHLEGEPFADMVWHVRAAVQLASGFDLRKLIVVDPNMTPQPADLGDYLWKHGVRAPPSALAVADSHACAYEWFHDLDHFRLLHVDAHHDLGYRAPELGCDNWIAHLVNADKVERVHLVYPEWRMHPALVEWDEHSERIAESWRREGIDVDVTYGLSTLPANVNCEKLFLCRSGAWVPPWLDDQFTACYRGLACRYGAPTILDGNGRDALCRDFDWEAVERLAKGIRRA